MRARKTTADAGIRTAPRHRAQRSPSCTSRSPAGRPLDRRLRGARALGSPEARADVAERVHHDCEEIGLIVDLAPSCWTRRHGSFSSGSVRCARAIRSCQRQRLVRGNCFARLIMTSAPCCRAPVARGTLKLELTESPVMEKPRTCRADADRIRELGGPGVARRFGTLRAIQRPRDRHHKIMRPSHRLRITGRVHAAVVRRSDWSI